MPARSADEVSVPAVPGVARLGWMIFMQPFRLRSLFEAWGLYDSPWTTLRELWHQGDTLARSIVVKLLVLLAVSTPSITATLVFGAHLTIGSSDYGAATVQAALGVAVGIIVGMTRGVEGGLAGGAVGAAVVGIIIGGMSVLIDKWAIVTAGGVLVGLNWGVAVSFSHNPATDEMMGMVAALAAGVLAIAVGADGVVAWMAAGAFTLGVYGIPLLLLEVGVTVLARSTQAFSPSLALSFARWLPFRHHDLIHFPLPGLRGYFVRLADHNPPLARQLIDEASQTLAQGPPAARALLELQARALETAARDRHWHAASTLDLPPFLPALDTLPPEDPLRRFAAAAERLYAAQNNRNQRRRLRLLHEAERQLESQSITLLTLPPKPDARSRRLAIAIQVWRDVIADEERRLRAEIAADPELPRVYIPGPALDPRDPDAIEIFRARKDLLGVIEHDLSDERRGALVVLGQRRMGKTSLLRMLAPHLGGGTVIAALDFQRLSGTPHATAPHRWVVTALRDAIADAMPTAELPPLPTTDAWGASLEWLEATEGTLEATHARALVTIDEVERVDDGIAAGWGVAFLDFVRAAGDRLRHIRLLLACAHPFERLGPVWADRLISVELRPLGPLPRGDAESLLRQPVPDFPPEVFDDAATAAVLAQTGGHPYLIQLVGDAVVRRLNEQRGREATARDIEAALDMALERVRGKDFPALWQMLSDAERGRLRRLAGGDAIATDDAVFRDLRDRHYLVEGTDGPAFAFPLFARWIRDHAPTE